MEQDKETSLGGNGHVSATRKGGSDPLEKATAYFTQPHSVSRPDEQSMPFVFSSPHSGRDYPEIFKSQSALALDELRRSEDCFVDEIFADAPVLGAPIISANFPRAFCDVNREPYELDPRMFKERLPRYVNSRSLRVASGLGTIARVVGDNTEIYRRKLTFHEVRHRIEKLYMPYHATLLELLEETCGRFGHAILVDCHSMPSHFETAKKRFRKPSPDIILGDRFGTSCDRAITDTVENHLKGLGYNIHRNEPYAGGFCTEHYGSPATGFHAIQIEINRGLYMDEVRYETLPQFDTLRSHMAAMMQELKTLTAALRRAAD